MVDMITFQQALDDSEQYNIRHLILGNGFSIACCPDIFHYGSLLDQASFGDRLDLREIFDAIETQDFETVIRILEDAAIITPFYVDSGDSVAKSMHGDAQYIKEVLLSTIAGNHPSVPADIPDEKFWACRRFLNNFLGLGRRGKVFTLNYDLLLYWTLMHDSMPFDEPMDIERNDGFGNVEDDPEADYVVWHGDSGAHQTRVHYLHGALHLFDAGYELQKYTWNRTNSRLIDQAREAINENKFPLFVAEGSSSQKKAKIRHNAYLYQGFKHLTANAQTGTHCFFIYGHSLAENDTHILSRLGKGRFKKLYISLYGDATTDRNREVIASAERIAALRPTRFPLELAFYDAQSVNVWGNSD